MIFAYKNICRCFARPREAHDEADAAEPLAEQDLPAAYGLGDKGVDGPRRDFSGDRVHRGQYGHDPKQEIDDIEPCQQQETDTGLHEAAVETDAEEDRTSQRLP